MHVTESQRYCGAVGSGVAGKPAPPRKASGFVEKVNGCVMWYSKHHELSQVPFSVYLPRGRAHARLLTPDANTS